MLGRKKYYYDHVFCKMWKCQISVCMLVVCRWLQVPHQRGDSDYQRRMGSAWQTWIQCKSPLSLRGYLARNGEVVSGASQISTCCVSEAVFSEKSRPCHCLVLSSSVVGSCEVFFVCFHPSLPLTGCSGPEGVILAVWESNTGNISWLSFPACSCVDPCQQGVFPTKFKA